MPVAGYGLGTEALEDQIIDFIVEPNKMLDIALEIADRCAQ
jgi:hypothetical protein